MTIVGRRGRSEAYTFDELDERAGAIAGNLIDAGIGPGVTVAAVATSSAGFITTALGAWYAGDASSDPAPEGEHRKGSVGRNGTRTDLVHRSDVLVGP